jgi:hypothetical protein
MSAFGGKADIRRKRSANEARADVRTCRLNNLQAAKKGLDCRRKQSVSVAKLIRLRPILDPARWRVAAAGLRW